MPKVFTEAPDARYELSDEVVEILGRARVLSSVAYSRRIHADRNYFPWVGCATTCEVYMEDEQFRMKLKDILVNGRVSDYHPRLPELFAIEEAYRVLEFRERIFGPDKLLNSPLSRHEIEGGDGMRTVDFNPATFLSQIIKGPWLDPNFIFEQSRQRGMEEGKRCADALGDSEMSAMYSTCNISISIPYIQRGSEDISLVGQAIERFGRRHLAMYEDIYGKIDFKKLKMPKKKK